MDDIQNFVIDVYRPVVESAMVVAAEYCKATGRTIVVSRDIEMGMKFAARHILGTHMGTMFPEIDDEESDDEVDEEGTVSEEDIDEEWSRYEGTDERFNMINASADTWDEWEPDTPVGRALKSAIEKSVDCV